MKILINTPDLTLPGGVSSHYLGLKPHWKEDVKYNVVGRRKKFNSFVILFYDYLSFFFLCFLKKPDVLVLNPSLNPRAIKRDYYFLKIANIFKIKTIVFFHGWDTKNAKKIDQNPSKFLKQFSRASSFIVLSNDFKQDLINWGFKQEIYLTTTKVSDQLITKLSLKSNKHEFSNSLLFLARLEEYKGIYIALDTFNILKKKFPNLFFHVVGDGSEINRCKKYVHKNLIKDVIFHGHLTGKNLSNMYIESDIYILPSYSEGMPTTVLEAMAFGLTIISRPVGGLKDFFQNKKMGYVIDSLQAEDFANKISLVLENPQQMKLIKSFNIEYAKKHFLASIVAKKLEEIFINQS